jgi:hypothetical protein
VDRIQPESKNVSALIAAFYYILGFFGTISQISLSRLEDLFITQSETPTLCVYFRDETKKKNTFRHDHLKALSFQTVGNLAVLAISALDPWFCAAIFR